MSVLRRTLLVSPSAFLMALASAPSVQALPPADPPMAERTLFTWNGVIDREVEIVVRGRSIQTRGSGLDASFAPRLDVRDALPRQVGLLSVHVVNGRGDVDVLEQPSPRNDYTARLRVRDPRGGRDNYRLIVNWEPLGFGGDPRRDDRRDDRREDRRDDRGRGNDDWNDRNDRNDRRDDGRWNNGRDRNAGSFSFRGDVDDVVDIRIQGRRVEYITRSGKRVRDVRSDIDGFGLPQRPVRLNLDVQRGRGSVLVLQEPNARNGYTAVIRVVDKRSGYGDYNFDLRWR